MIDLKHSPNTKLLWLDLEMTGLDPANDRILEVAAIVTDFNFKTISTYETRVRHNRDKLAVLIKKNAFWAKYPQSCDEFLNNLDSAKDSEQIQSELIALIRKYFMDEPVVLAGNSIHFDRQFIKRQWPRVEKLLHYRMLDVSSFKILMQNKYGLEYIKKETHRALDDIQESIAELKFYIDYFKKEPERIVK
jgi:oligoribonuclease